jgi:TIR domain
MMSKMKVFISWSGAQSENLARALKDWVPMVLQSVDPWLSGADIPAGDRWAASIADKLEDSNLGIICITPENIASPWILFEAGALAKRVQEGHVIPLLLDIELQDFAGPLAQFQAKKVEREGLFDVIDSINQKSDIKLTSTQLEKQFEALWPELEKAISAIPKNPTLVKQRRQQQEILEEVVSSIRGLDMRLDEGPRGRRRRYRFHRKMFEEMQSELGLRDPVRFLMFSSVLREDFPWIYELAAEAYRASVRGDPLKAKEAKHDFITALNVLRRAPSSEMPLDNESHTFLRLLEGSLEEMTILEPTEKSRPTDDARAAGVASDALTDKDCSPEAIAARRERIDRLVAQVATLPVLDPRSSQEIADDLNAL